MDYKNTSDLRRSYASFRAVETSVQMINSNYVDFGRGVDASSLKFLADGGRRLDVSQFPALSIRVTVTTGSLLDVTLEHSYMPTSTLRPLPSPQGEAVIPGNKSREIWRGPMPPGYLAINTGGRTGLEVEIGAVDGDGPHPESFFGATYDRSVGVSTSSGTWKTGAVIQVPNPRRFREILPYYENTSNNGNATDTRTLIARDSTLEVADIPTGTSTPVDGDGWLERYTDTIASGGDGPDISGAGLAVSTHLAVAQILEGGGGETLNVELDGTEA